MNNNRCVNCGFLNFPSSPTCKRCKAAFLADSGHGHDESFGGYTPEWQPAYESAPHLPQPTFQAPYFPSPVAPLPRTSKNSGTNAMLLSLLGIAVVIAGGIGVLWKFRTPASANHVWQQYKAKDESFTVLMPATPTESVQSKETPVGTLSLHVSLADLKTEAYLVGYSDYPDNFMSLPAETVLDGAEQGAIHESGSTLVSKKRITLDGYPGIELEIKPPAGGPKGVGVAYSRMYWVAPRLYIAFAGGMDTGATRLTIKKFLDSFKILKK